VDSDGKMGRDGINQMPVMRGNNLVGMLSRGDIVKYLQTLQQWHVTKDRGSGLVCMLNTDN